jgi:hypothetical protein
VSVQLEYTLKQVIATLSMIDSPGTTITITPSQADSIDLKEPLLETGPTVTTVRAKPLTTSIRGTLRHLTATAGRLARWRGLILFMAYGMTSSIVMSFISVLVPRFPGREMLVSAATGALLANLHAAWTHKVISMPSSKGIRESLPDRQAWKTLALPAAVYNSVAYLCVYLLLGLMYVLRIQDVDLNNDFDVKAAAALLGKLAAVVAAAILCGLFIVLPATVTLIRIEASLLPEEQETIVPFDRTFAGKVVPRVLGGTGAVGFLDAWKSFTWEARRRVLKLYVKINAIIMVVALVFAHVLVFEVWAIMGPAVQKWLVKLEAQNSFGGQDANVHWEGY